MWFFNSLTACIFIVFLHSYADAKSKTDQIWTLNREWPVKKNDYFSYDKLLSKVDGTFLYATCQPIMKSELQGINCTFTLKNILSTLGDDQRDKMTCNVNLFPTNRERLIQNFNSDSNPIITMERFITDSIFFSWSEGDNGGFLVKKYGYINMPNCEFGKVKEFEVATNSNDRSSKSFVLYRNMFDVIDFKNSSGETCDQKLCRFPHAFDRKSDDLKTASFPSNVDGVFSVQPVNYDDDDDGFFVLSFNNTSAMIASHVTKSGEVKTLFSIPKESAAEYWYPSYSRYRLSVCYSPTRDYKIESADGTFKCKQYSYHPSGLRTGLNSVLDVANTGEPWKKLKGHSSKILALQNLSDEGLMILTGNCSLNSCNHMKALKVHQDVKDMKDPFDVPEVNFDCKIDHKTLSIDIRNEINHHAFFFAALCEGTGDNNIIKYKRVDVNNYD